MRVIGLDLGTKTGYAYSQDGKVRAAHSGVADFAPRRHEGGGMRFLRFRKFLVDLVGEPEDTVIFFEEVAAQAHRSGNAAHIYGGFLGVLSEFCESREIPFRGLPIGTIKKHATRSPMCPAGRGNANKNDMIAHASRQFGRVESHDQADALWTLSLGLKEMNE